MRFYPLLEVLCWATFASASPTVVDSRNNVTYNGITRNGLDVFLGLNYGQDTSGQNRFKAPVFFALAAGSVIDATSYGPACPQPLGETFAPLRLSTTTNTSEDCLNLNLVRPNDTLPASKLPVLVFIHGGQFFFNSKAEITNAPDGLILQSIKNKTPIIHVSINYRLGAFGFARSTALRNEGSENAGLRDQRLAIEWVRDNIEIFGGDPEKITVHGQSSGGLAVGMQILAYGGIKPAPFQQAICESQALEPGITGNFTLVQMQLLAGATGCNSTDLDSTETIQCLRALNTTTFAQASFDTWSEDLSANGGDSWLPNVDGDFLPAAPSQLLSEGRFANITTMVLWCDADMSVFTPTTIVTSQDTFDFIYKTLPAFTNHSINDMLSLYPSSDFTASPDTNLTREFYRAARIYRDIWTTCQPIGFAESLAAKGNTIYLIDQNATILSPILASLGMPGLGPVHTSNFAYTFGNLSHYDVDGYSFNPTADDYRLEQEESGSWAAFTFVGQPSLYTKKTLRGFGPAYATPNQTAIFVAGGANEGLSFIDGPDASPALAEQKLRERCAFWNFPAIIAQLQV